MAQHCVEPGFALQRLPGWAWLHFALLLLRLVDRLHLPQKRGSLLLGLGVMDEAALSFRAFMRLLHCLITRVALKRQLLAQRYRHSGLSLRVMELCVLRFAQLLPLKIITVARIDNHRHILERRHMMILVVPVHRWKLIVPESVAVRSHALEGILYLLRSVRGFTAVNRLGRPSRSIKGFLVLACDGVQIHRRYTPLHKTVWVDGLNAPDFFRLEVLLLQRFNVPAVGWLASLVAFTLLSALPARARSTNASTLDVFMVLFVFLEHLLESL